MESPQHVTLGALRRQLRSELTPKYGEREAAAMARVIIQTLKGWSLEQLVASEDSFTASDYLLNRSSEIVSQLLDDMPLQYALGVAPFYGLTLKVGPGVLIPRPETEELVDLVVKENKESDLEVLDLCTGSGAIALALARNLSFPSVTGIDVSPDALKYACENAEALKARVRFDRKDIFSLSLPAENLDIIVSNPPYVDESEKAEMEPNVLKYEPEEALFVPDDDPLLFYRRISRLAIEALKPGGRLYFEINPRHARELRQLLEADGFEEVNIIKDVHGKERFISAQKPR